MPSLHVCDGHVTCGFWVPSAWRTQQNVTASFVGSGTKRSVQNPLWCQKTSSQHHTGKCSVNANFISKTPQCHSRRDPGGVLQAGNWQHCCPHHLPPLLVPQERSLALLSEPTALKFGWSCTAAECSIHSCLPCNTCSVGRGMRYPAGSMRSLSMVILERNGSPASKNG